MRAILVPDSKSGYVAQCLDVDVVSQGDTAKEAVENLKEAVALYRESFGERD